jgi:hypothetical protein
MIEEFLEKYKDKIKSFQFTLNNGENVKIIVIDEDRNYYITEGKLFSDALLKMENNLN